MAVLVGRDTRLLVQGITGYQGMFHTDLMLQAGTRVVAGVTPGRGGSHVHGVPVFEAVDEAVRETGATASVIFVPARFARDAVLESVASRLDPVVIITEGMPVRDAIEVVTYAARQGVRVLGPNGPGVTTPGQCRVGIMPTHLFAPGRVGVVSRSGTLTYEIVAGLTRAGLGQSTAVGLGGDPDAIVLIGEIGGRAEEDAAEYIAAHVRKPVAAYIAGRTAPEGKRMGHAGAVISGTEGTAAHKIQALEAAGAPVATLVSGVPALLQERLRASRTPRAMPG
ncbi:MAG: succinate--CoA ligase subunit alpha [Bacillati bacterium ANGP1]|uniref:Succinate--CoA ligase [ADP-forming] subunit alpha n=1 Tax=Candidatus Segetimicrobium genomatis TaxID=2569760 RepID=A0A537M570_9BACT|nr:MAG: succinate--CoA ligase subunit alpha [Terrabacteria group bacterium ANGP1]